MLRSEKLKDKDSSHPPSWIFKKSVTSHQGKILLVKKQLENSYVHTSYVNCKAFCEVTLQFN